MLFVKIASTFLNHRKLLKLHRATGLDLVLLRGHLVTLWLHVLQHRPDGRLDDWDDEDIEIMSGFLPEMCPTGQTGQISDWADNLGRCGFLVRDGDTWCISDWEQYCSLAKLEETRRKERERKRRYREKKRNEAKALEQEQKIVPRDTRDSPPVSQMSRPEREREREREREIEDTDSSPEVSLEAVRWRSAERPYSWSNQIEDQFQESVRVYLEAWPGKRGPRTVASWKDWSLLYKRALDAEDHSRLLDAIRGHAKNKFFVERGLTAYKYAVNPDHTDQHIAAATRTHVPGTRPGTERELGEQQILREMEALLDGTAN